MSWRDFYRRFLPWHDGQASCRFLTVAHSEKVRAKLRKTQHILIISKIETHGATASIFRSRYVSLRYVSVAEEESPFVKKENMRANWEAYLSYHCFSCGMVRYIWYGSAGSTGTVSRFSLQDYSRDWRKCPKLNWIEVSFASFVPEFIHATSSTVSHQRTTSYPTTASFAILCKYSKYHTIPHIMWTRPMMWYILTLSHYKISTFTSYLLSVMLFVWQEWGTRSHTNPWPFLPNKFQMSSPDFWVKTSINLSSWAKFGSDRFRWDARAFVKFDN